MYKGILRRVLSLVMVLALFMTSCTVGYCETSNAIEFDTTLTDALLEGEDEEFFDSSYKRALLTVCISLDLFVYSGMFDTTDDKTLAMMGVLYEESYVAKDEDNFLVYIHLTDDDILIVYKQGEKGAYYCMMPVIEDDVLEEALGGTAKDGCYENNSQYIEKAWEGIKRILLEEDE